jgi:hypothetical protein
VIVGLVHPGEMGAAIGAAVHEHDVIWASEGRSDATRARAAAFRTSARSPRWSRRRTCCFPSARRTQRSTLRAQRSGFDGIYVDANAISPAHAQEIAACTTLRRRRDHRWPAAAPGVSHRRGGRTLSPGCSISTPASSRTRRR